MVASLKEAILKETTQAFLCQNCRFIFSETGTADASVRVCPRCNSKNTVKQARQAPAADTQSESADKKTVRLATQHYKIGSTQRVFGETKEAWKSFHSSEIASCPHCGGTRFSLDFKHKEKVCLNCGTVLSLRRKQV